MNPSRHEELRQLQRLLAYTRLLTLTGPGGIGKTSLALTLAHAVVDSHRDGAWLVELSDVTQGRFVARAIASSLGLAEQPGLCAEDQLVGYLRSQRLLLLLDNCEHLAPDCTAVARALLEAAPGLRIIFTSRELLNLPGDVVYSVPGLSLPDALSGRIEKMRGCDAMLLFAERMRAHHSQFVLDDATGPVVCDICRQLGGHPLAIELAAARGRHLSLTGLRHRLTKLSTLDSGTPAAGRHSSLRVALDWSYRLLSRGERGVFTRLSICQGGFDLETCAAFWTGPTRTVGLVARTRSRPGGGHVCRPRALLAAARPRVAEGRGRCMPRAWKGRRRRPSPAHCGGVSDRYLLRLDEGHQGGTRYYCLEPLRQYARELLRGSGDFETCAAQHAGHFAALVGAAQHGLWNQDQAAWLVRLEDESANLMVALDC